MKRDHFILKTRPALFFFLFLLAVPSAFGEEKNLSLEVIVNNPSPESRLIHVRAVLPRDLTRNDILDADGLDVKYDAPSSSYYVEGDVVLQSKETTFYTIQVKNVWTIPSADLDELRNAMNRVPVLDRSGFEARLKIILERQEKSLVFAQTEVKKLIESYSENRTELDRLISEVRSAQRGSAIQGSGFQYPILLGLAALAGVYAITRWTRSRRGASQKSRIEKRKFQRLAKPLEVTCHVVLVDEEKQLAETASVAPLDISEGGVCLDLPEAYKVDTVLEIEIRIESAPEPLHFMGAVVWQKKIKGTGIIGLGYLSGIKIYEATQEDLAKLKEYMETHLV